MILRSISFTFSLMFIFAFFSSQPLLAQEKEPQKAASQKSEKESPEEEKQKGEEPDQKCHQSHHCQGWELAHSVESEFFFKLSLGHGNQIFFR